MRRASMIIATVLMLSHLPHIWDPTMVQVGLLPRIAPSYDTISVTRAYMWCILICLGNQICRPNGSLGASFSIVSTFYVLVVFKWHSCFVVNGINCCWKWYVKIPEYYSTIVKKKLKVHYLLLLASPSNIVGTVQMGCGLVVSIMFMSCQIFTNMWPWLALLTHSDRANSTIGWKISLDSKVHRANMGPTWGRQDPGGPHVGPMNLAVWFHIMDTWYLARCRQSFFSKWYLIIKYQIIDN